MFSVVALGIGAAYVYGQFATFAPDMFPAGFRGMDGAVAVYFGRIAQQSQNIPGEDARNDAAVFSCPLPHDRMQPSREKGGRPKAARV